MSKRRAGEGLKINVELKIKFSVLGTENQCEEQRLLNLAEVNI